MNVRPSNNDIKKDEDFILNRSRTYIREKTAAPQLTPTTPAISFR